MFRLNYGRNWKRFRQLNHCYAKKEFDHIFFSEKLKSLKKSSKVLLKIRQLTFGCSESGGAIGLRAAGGQDPAEDPTGGNPDPGPVFRLVSN